jgi:hypothetical protein
MFYYLAGIAVFLALAGLVFMLQTLTGGQCCSSSNNDVMCLDSYYLGGYAGGGYDGVNCCCCVDCPHAACCESCCHQGSTTCCAECGAGCSDCSIASAGGEVALVLFALLAIIGLIVAVFVGIYFTQQVSQALKTYLLPLTSTMTTIGCSKACPSASETWISEGLHRCRSR